jgi:hypothetical protein
LSVFDGRMEFLKRGYDLLAVMQVVCGPCDLNWL